MNFLKNKTCFSSESENNKSIISGGSSQSSIDSFFKEIVNQEEGSDSENSQSIEEKEIFARVINNKILNKNRDSYSEDLQDDDSSSVDSFYSFESEENNFERKVSFGSIKSLPKYNGLYSIEDRKFLRLDL